MQEKSSRVVEVLLATVRPIQLLGGKVLGIGLVALGQATLIVGFALVVGAGGGLRPAARHGAAGARLRAALAGPRVRLLLLGLRRRRLDRRAPGPGADARPAAQHPDPARLHLLDHRGELGQSQTSSSRSSPTCPRRPRSACRCWWRSSQVTWWEFVASVLITIAGDGRHGHLRGPHLPAGRAPDRLAGAAPGALRPISPLVDRTRSAFDARRSGRERHGPNSFRVLSPSSTKRTPCPPARW